MLLRVIATAVVIVGVMVGIKNGHVLQRLELTGSCSVVATPKGQSGEWRACTAGRLAGQPDLSRDSCTRQSAMADVVYWRCPTSIESSPLRP
jgi:hypothetical protein